MDTTHDDDTEIARLRAEISRLLDRIDRLEGRRESCGRESPGGGSVGEARSTPPSRGGRRDLLRLAGAAATGAAAAGVLGGRPVAADDPNDLTLGSSKTTAGKTGATYTGGSTTGLAFRFSSSTGIFAIPPGTSGQRGTLGGFADQGLDTGVDGATVSAAGYGVFAHSYVTGGTALRAETYRGTAVVGESTNTDPANAQGTGVAGFANGTGVAGTAVSTDPNAGFGVRGVGRVGVAGFGGQYAFEAFEADLAQLRLTTTTAAAAPRSAPPSRTDAHEVGEIDLDGSGGLWLCVEAGTPGVWRELAGPTSAGAFHPVTPFRAYDSRRSNPDPGVLGPGASRVVSVADGRDGTTGAVIDTDLVPVGATAIAFNLTVVNTVGRGFLAVTEGDAASTEASTINWRNADQVIANSATVRLDGDRRIKVSNGSLGSANFIVDITGFWR